MGFPVGMFAALFAMPRTAGWLAHWEETLKDDEQKSARPRQVYEGADTGDLVPIRDRG
jgi:citrate synthase